MLTRDLFAVANLHARIVHGQNPFAKGSCDPVLPITDKRSLVYIAPYDAENVVTCNKLYETGGRHDMPPPLSSPVGAEAHRAAEQTAT